MAGQGGQARCNDRCGCPVPCPGGTSCRCRSRETASSGGDPSMEHMREEVRFHSINQSRADQIRSLRVGDPSQRFAMFVKKLVDKATKKVGGNLNGLKSDDVNPRLVFHYGIPAGSTALAYDSTQRILAISTKDGRIKLLGTDNTQALLESNEAVSSKFLQFIENQGILLNVTLDNRIEVWDIERKHLSHIHIYNKGEITSFGVVRHSLFIYVGDSVGNVSVLKLDPETHHLVCMKYNIPFSASHGNTTEFADDNAVIYVIPQPMAEAKRCGIINLWGVEESKTLFVTGGNIHNSQSHEAKKVTSACWACLFGSKVVVGYNNGEIYLWGVAPSSHSKTASVMIHESSATPNVPIYKLNLMYKVEKTPILSLKCVYGDGKASRLYVRGDSASSSSNMLQIILLNEHMETRTIKLGLPLPEPCITCVYDDSAIEKYLLQCQSRSPPSLPKQINIRIPFVDPSITVSKLVTNASNLFGATDEDYNLLAKNYFPLIPVDAKAKDENHMSSVHFNGFTSIKNLYITGHTDGTIHFWDVSCPFPLPIALLKHQNEDNHFGSAIPVTALHFDIAPRILISGDQSGVVRIFKFKPEPFSSDSSLFSLQGNSKKGSSHIVQSVKIVKVNGAVLSINMNRGFRHLAIGCEQGYVSLIDMEGPTLLFQQHIPSDLASGVISLQFGTCNFQGFEKNTLLVATKDSTVLALEVETGNTLSATAVRPNKPSRALFMQILGHCLTLHVSDDSDLNKRNSSLLLCNEKAVYIYSLPHAVQGIKKVQFKKKFQGVSCCWASTFCKHDSDVALALLFTSGKIEVRSLPELSILKETSIRGLIVTNSNPDISICSSSDGELVLVNGDQEIFYISLLLRKEIYRILDSVSAVYKGALPSQEALFFESKEKKKGIFSSVIKDMRGTKEKQVPVTEAIDSRTAVGDELSTIFSINNFPLETDNTVHINEDENEVELSIEKPKGRGMIAALNKQKITNKFQAIRGKLKQKMVKNEKLPAKEEPEDEKIGTVDQIKKRYGFPLHGETGAVKMAENKLHQNLARLKGINTRATEMQDTAQSFSAMAKQLLRTAEQDKPSI
ncbi:hypothetical protein Syun_005624 [Stephania yunnanensis]|uniref:Lethal giant larvae (Lgl)-like C-terminal domain-containing protein n=1 Tax=Stephania yunnanensis TaxID=152371 RepID=A0AAP0Q1X3_9MAGN